MATEDLEVALNVDAPSLRLLRQAYVALHDAEMEDTVVAMRERFSLSRRIFETGTILEGGHNRAVASVRRAVLAAPDRDREEAGPIDHREAG
jgi:hypothetical protein